MSFADIRCLLRFVVCCSRVALRGVVCCLFVAVVCCVLLYVAVSCSLFVVWRLLCSSAFIVVVRC